MNTMIDTYQSLCSSIK